MRGISKKSLKVIGLLAICYEGVVGDVYALSPAEIFTPVARTTRRVLCSGAKESFGPRASSFRLSSFTAERFFSAKKVPSLLSGRSYSSSTRSNDVEAPWNKGFVPTVQYAEENPIEHSPLNETPSSTPNAHFLSEQQQHHSKRVWHFDPVRALYYYRSYYSPQQEESAGVLSPKEPIKETEDMVVFALKKKA